MPSQRAVRTLPKTAGGRKTALPNRGFTPRKEFSTMKREDVKNKIPSITDIAQAPEAARLGEPTKSP